MPADRARATWRPTAPTAAPAWSLVTVELLQALCGIAVGLAGMPAMTEAFRAARDYLIDATTMANILQCVGGSLGSVIIVIATVQTNPQLAAFQTSYAILLAGVSLALADAAAHAITECRKTLSRHHRRSPDSQHDGWAACACCA